MMRKGQEILAHLEALHTTHFGGAPSRSGARPAVLASAPGRVELAGNHTDHQGGRTISAAIGRRAWALASPSDANEARIFMDGFGTACIRLDDLDPHEGERGTSASLIRGMIAAFSRSGRTIRGFDLVTCSDIPVGRGLSSSAAFEVLMGAVIRALCDDSGSASPADLTAIALEAVRAERTYFGKPCGAQDQLACAHGGIVALDFAEESPRITPLRFDFDACPYETYLVDTRCDHSGLTAEYAAIPADMRAVAGFFGYGRLADLPYRTFLDQLPQVRAQLGDQAALRAMHYFEETQRVASQIEALQKDDFEAFLAMVRQSGASSAQFLQNVSPRSCAAGADQPAMFALALCAHLLDGTHPDGGLLRGAYRIHGGGFGGSILAFVPSQDAPAFEASMNALLGYDACMPVTVGAPGVQATRII